MKASAFSALGRLTASDWEEVLCALETKARSVERGDYDIECGEVARGGSETSKWALHLREIIRKLEGDRWMALLIQVRRATITDQREVLRWLLKKFPGGAE
jgi:hypothetical protein